VPGEQREPLNAVRSVPFQLGQQPRPDPLSLRVGGDGQPADMPYGPVPAGPDGADDPAVANGFQSESLRQLCLKLLEALGQGREEAVAVQLRFRDIRGPLQRQNLTGISGPDRSRGLPYAASLAAPKTLRAPADAGALKR
jgi:hypothetical protein